MPLTYPDAVALAQATLQANLPSAAVRGDSLISNHLSAVAAVIDQAVTDQLATAYQLSLATASGTYLDALANQVGVYRNPGSVATGTYVFTLTPGPATAVTIPAYGALLSTVSTPAIYFTNTTDVAIPAPLIAGNPSSSAAVPIAAVAAGSAGTVGANTITLVNYQLGDGALTGTNPSGTTGGADRQSDSDLRAAAQAVTTIKYGDNDLTAAVLLVPGVWDCWINDPAAPAGSDNNPSGSVTASNTYTCYWCDGNGAQVLASAATVKAALLATQAAGLVPTLAAFTVVNLTAVTVNYRVPAGISAGYIEPLIKAAVANYVLSLVHNQIPDAFNLGQYVQAAVGGVLTGFALGATTPSIGSASHSTIYRLNGSPSTVVTTTPF